VQFVFFRLCLLTLASTSACSSGAYFSPFCCFRFCLLPSVLNLHFVLPLVSQHLYTHERFTDYNVLLGFGDGEVQHIDMRVQHKMYAA